MAKFPLTRAPERLGVTPTTAVRAGLDVPVSPVPEAIPTGEEAIGRAVAGFGGAMVDLGVKYDITQGETQLSEFQRKVNEEIYRVALSFNTNLDPETYRADYKKSLDLIHSWMPSNRRAARGAQIWLNAKEPAWLADVDKARFNRANDNWMAELFTKQTSIGQTGQMGSFPAFIAEGVKAGRIDKSDAVEILAKTNKMAVRGQIVNLYRTGNYNAARELVEASTIFTPEEKVALQKNINTAERAKDREQKTLVDIYVEQAHKSAVSELVNNINNIDFVGDLPEELQEYWQEKLDKRATGLEKDEDTFNQYDPVLFNGLKQQIRETPDKVDYMDIIDSVGNGLTPVQAQELFELQDEMQRKDSPLAQSHIKRAHDRINDLQSAGLVIKGIEPPTPKSTPEETIRYMNIFDEMHDAIDRNTDLKPAEMRKYTEEMVRPVAEEAGKGFWGILRETLGWQPTMYGFALGSAYMERERLLRTRPIDRSDFEMKFKNLYKVDPDTANRYWDRWEGEL